MNFGNPEQPAASGTNGQGQQQGQQQGQNVAAAMGAPAFGNAHGNGNNNAIVVPPPQPFMYQQPPQPYMYQQPPPQQIVPVQQPPQQQIMPVQQQQQQQQQLANGNAGNQPIDWNAIMAQYSDPVAALHVFQQQNAAAAAMMPAGHPTHVIPSTPVQQQPSTPSINISAGGNVHVRSSVTVRNENNYTVQQPSTPAPGINISGGNVTFHGPVNSYTGAPAGNGNDRMASPRQCPAPRQLLPAEGDEAGNGGDRRPRASTDAALAKSVEALAAGLNEVEERQEILAEDVGGLRDDVESLAGNVEDLDGKVQDVQCDVLDLADDAEVLRDNVTDLAEDTGNVRNDVNVLANDLEALAVGEEGTVDEQEQDDDDDDSQTVIGSDNGTLAGTSIDLNDAAGQVETEAEDTVSKIPVFLLMTIFRHEHIL